MKECTKNVKSKQLKIIILLLFLICIITILYFNFEQIYINQKVEIHDFDIATIDEIFKPYVNDYSIKVNKQLFLQSVTISPKNYIEASYENNDRGNIFIITISAVKKDNDWIVEKIIRQRDAKLIKLSRDSLYLEKWNYDLQYFLRYLGKDISDVKRVLVENGLLQILFQDKAIFANPISGEISGI